MKKIPGILLLLIAALLVLSCDQHHSGGHMMGGGMMGSQRISGIDQDSIPEPDSEAARLYQHYCSQCHELPALTMHSADQWPDVVARMKQYMRTSNKMSPDQRETQQIIGYLQTYAE